MLTPPTGSVPRNSRLTVRASLLVAMVMIAALAAPGGTASTAAVVALDPGAGPAGTAVTVSGSGFPTRSSGRIMVGGAAVASVRTDAAGTFVQVVDIPHGASGDVTVTAAIRKTTASVTYTVVASDQPASVLFGVSTPAGTANLAELDAFERAAGKSVGLVMWYQGFAYHDFDRAGAEAITARGAIPMITWEPWDYLHGVDQPQYRLAAIAAGTHDEYLTRWAEEARAWGGRLLLRFAHEMNGDWYPWSEGVNANAPGDFVAAWRHVHDLFTRVGAANVEWVWSPNVSYEGSAPLGPLYPGTDYTDWVALDGYNWGTTVSWHRWTSFADIFSASIAEVERIAPDKPLLIGETASTEHDGDKAAWISDMFDVLSARPAIAGFVWFDHDKETDWRITSSPAARTAFAAGVSDPRYG